MFNTDEKSPSLRAGVTGRLRKIVSIRLETALLHRHLHQPGYSLAAIDDIIARGRLQDWYALRQALLQDPGLLDRVLRVCEPHLPDPYAQRYHFWKHYAERKRRV